MRWRADSPLVWLVCARSAASWWDLRRRREGFACWSLVAGRGEAGGVGPLGGGGVVRLGQRRTWSGEWSQHPHPRSASVMLALAVISREAHYLTERILGAWPRVAGTRVPC